MVRSLCLCRYRWAREAMRKDYLNTKVQFR